ncbi:MAG: tRNA pseudouridine(38-40) synthase TruA [Oscillospiraceae bacterium]|nr:tRNA pseudouridine(38-40) synthase TruA [Oscillospiraceae bacterium]
MSAGDSRRVIALRLAFDGARYHGWQEQAADATVAGTLKAAVRRVCPDAGPITGCSRTDAGVHALRYCASFKTGSAIPAERLPRAVNTYLPPDIVVSAAAVAPEGFNAILSCEKKEYVYKVHNAETRDPFLYRRTLFYPRALDLDKMRRAAAGFVGERDFAAVRSVGSPTRTTVRTVFRCEVEKSGAEVAISVCADGFLYNMARAIVGTLLYVSEGKIQPDAIPALLETRDRNVMGPTAPAEGLYLSRIWYGGTVGEMMEG